jgi:hypothetical protein
LALDAAVRTPSIEALKPAPPSSEVRPLPASDAKPTRPHRPGVAPEPPRKKPKHEPNATPSEVETEWK